MLDMRDDLDIFNVVSCKSVSHFPEYPAGILCMILHMEYSEGLRLICSEILCPSSMHCIASGASIS